MRTLKQVEDEIAALYAANKMAWTERNACTDLRRGREIRLGLVRRLFKIDILRKERDRLKKLTEPGLSASPN
jgi:hypothetical protein